MRPAGPTRRSAARWRRPGRSPSWSRPWSGSTTPSSTPPAGKACSPTRRATCRPPRSSGRSSSGSWPSSRDAPTRPMRDTGHRVYPARAYRGPMLFPTSLVGSYPQPGWLIDRERLRHRFPPRVRARELWRVDPEYLAEAQDDATLLAIRAQEQAGLDILTDGEIRRESYSNRFATALDGVDIDNPGTALDRSGHPNPVPRVTGPVRRRHPVEVEDVMFLQIGRAHV